MTADFETNVFQLNTTDIRTLALLLDSPESNVCISALEGLTRYAEETMKNRQHLLDFGILKKLKELLSSNNVEIKKRTVSCIAATTELNQLHPDLRQTDFIKMMVQLLSQEDVPEIQEEAAFTLTNLAIDAANKHEIRKAGGMAALVKSLDYPDPDTKRNSALALASLLEDYGNRTELRLSGGLTKLFDMCNSEFIETQECALLSIQRCAEDFSNRVQFRKLNGLKKLFERWGSSEDTKIKILCLQCISSLLDDAEANSKLSELGVISNLVRSLETNHAKSTAIATQVISKAAKNDKNLENIKDAGAVSILFSNINDSDSNISSQSLTALSVIIRRDDLLLEFSKGNYLEYTVRQLTSEDEGVKIGACLLLASAAADAKMRIRARQLDGLSTLCRILSTATGKLLQSSCKAIHCIAEDATNQSELTKMGIIELLLNCFDRDEDFDSIKMILLTLSRCLQDGDARCEFQDGQGLSKVVCHLASKEKEICQNACWTLSSAAQLDSIAYQICQSGAIDLLLEIANDNNNYSAKFAARALNSVLNNYLPAKYWLTNELSSEDIIKDGFYDIGYRGINTKQTTKFPSLKMLTSETVSKKREVIHIDAWNDPSLLNMLEALSTEIIETHKLKPLDLNSSVSPQVHHVEIIASGKEVKDTKEKEQKEAKEREREREKDKEKEKEKEVKDKDIKEGSPKEGLGQQGKRNIQIPLPCNPNISLSQNPLANPYNMTPEVIKSLAIFVSKRMGGAVEASKVNELGYKFKITECKMRIKSNVIPITMITVGTFYHRALLFKVLMDWLCYGPGAQFRKPGMGCQLCRGEYGRAWNTIKVNRSALSEAGETSRSRTSSVTIPKAGDPISSTLPYKEMSCKGSDFEEVEVIVDLMFEPGRLMLKNSVEAQLYQRYS